MKVKKLSKVIQNLKNRDRVTVRVAATEIPLHICIETLTEVGDLRYYQEKAAIEVNGVLFVQDAP